MYSATPDAQQPLAAYPASSGTQYPLLSARLSPHPTPAGSLTISLKAHDELRRPGSTFPCTPSSSSLPPPHSSFSTPVTSSALRPQWNLTDHRSFPSSSSSSSSSSTHSSSTLYNPPPLSLPTFPPPIPLTSTDNLLQPSTSTHPTTSFPPSTPIDSLRPSPCSNSPLQLILSPFDNSQLRQRLRHFHSSCPNSLANSLQFHIKHLNTVFAKLIRSHKSHTSLTSSLSNSTPPNCFTIKYNKLNNMLTPSTLESYSTILLNTVTQCRHSLTHSLLEALTYDTHTLIQFFYSIINSCNSDVSNLLTHLTASQQSAFSLTNCWHFIKSQTISLPPLLNIPATQHNLNTPSPSLSFFLTPPLHSQPPPAPLSFSHIHSLTRRTLN